jgi:hypothetical protein
VQFYAERRRKRYMGGRPISDRLWDSLMRVPPEDHPQVLDYVQGVAFQKIRGEPKRTRCEPK